MRDLNVGIIGYKFMGKAHSNAWLKAPRFFDLPARPVLKVACGRHADAVHSFADKWGWDSIETEWRRLVERDDIDIIDISVPTKLHHDIAVAAAKNGKHIFCEKPMSFTVEEAQSMLDAARKTGVVHYLNHNYRRTPAVMLAKRMIDDGRVGTIYHWRGAYQQDWILDPSFPLTWHLRKEDAFAGPHWDLNSHSVDLAHFLVGPIASVSCLTSTFIDERPLPDEAAAGTFKGASKGDATGKVTVDDAALMQVEFENGALGSFEATRFATGCKNRNTFEIYGSKGSLRFDLERMNELEYFSCEDDANAQGFRTIMVTEGDHPYVDHWWPPGHIIGYEHGFIHAVADFLQAVADGTEIRPSFEDGLACMRVLETGLQAAESGERVVVKRP